ncbi:tautomerase family protein [Motiliproteus sp. MSK22-1]|uniref:tautomerase family protein n=1 Tax=Motiliproteus sp. MSK22-1 TaxID=1897630 RepID=UPI000975CD2F|nr:tautomerase family protein [Motiliproteus sp. MSK22-1]OMH25825.1 hypothetical protein BGP75_25225 [Motiliproteus sp. MSK22-1]
MPFIEVRIAKNHIEDEIVRQVSTGIAEIMKDVLNKNYDLVAVTVTAVNPSQWLIANRSLDQSAQTSAFVCARITAGTNTEQQKSQALEDIHDLLQRTLGPLSEASYVVLKELPASDWGYSGKSQLSRQNQIKRNSNGSIDTEHYVRKIHTERSASVYFVFNKALKWLRSTLSGFTGSGSLKGSVR